MNKAPAGGMASEVNGQFYEGGEFMPDHGLYCGKGKNRVRQERFDAVSVAAIDAGYSLRYSEKWKRFELVKAGNVYFHAANLETLAKIVQ